MPVRILLLIPSGEPGRDGVGDYTRRLGDSLQNHGWKVFWGALYDPFTREESLSSDGQILRLPACLAGEVRRQRLYRFVAECEPDWISLQWVGFGYEKRGLPWGLIHSVARWRQGRSLHLYFHEIWLGEKPGLPFRQRVLGLLQKRLTCHAVCRWRPDVIHTSNRLYRSALARAGIGSEVLPLPGNIPIVENGRQFVPECISRADHSAIRIVLFCSLDLGWDVSQTIERLVGASKRLGRPIHVLGLGAFGPGSHLWERFEALCQSDPCVSACRLGRQSAEVISSILQCCDFGAVTKTRALLGKSGSFAALAEHGLPTIVLYNASESRLPVPEEQWEVPVLVLPDETTETFASWLGQTRRQNPAPRLKGVVDQLSTIFQASTSL